SWAYDSRRKEFLAGRGTLDILLRHTHYVKQAELAALGKDADVTAIAEQQWERVWEIARHLEPRYHAGRIAMQDLMQAKYEECEAEIELVQARAVQPKERRRGLLRPLQPPLIADETFHWAHGHQINWPLETKDLAAAKRAAYEADVQKLKKARLEAARVM